MLYLYICVYIFGIKSEVCWMARRPPLPRLVLLSLLFSRLLSFFFSFLSFAFFSLTARLLSLLTDCVCLPLCACRITHLAGCWRAAWLWAKPTQCGQCCCSQPPRGLGSRLSGTSRQYKMNKCTAITQFVWVTNPMPTTLPAFLLHLDMTEQRKKKKGHLGTTSGIWTLKAARTRVAIHHAHIEA